MRKIGVVTSSRSDYGIYLPLLKKIKQDPDLHLFLYVCGMHLLPEFGLTIREIEKDGFPITAKVKMLDSYDTPAAIAKSMAVGTAGFAQVFTRHQPDILIVLGDRFEMHSAVVASVPFLIPIAHIAGGAITRGAIDDVFRHSITLMSHLHFVELETYARRIIQMGEEPWRVTVTGALGLDNLNEINLLSLKDIEVRYGIKLDEAPLLVTFHPVTREYHRNEYYMDELLAALKEFDLPIVFTYPNADTNGRLIISMIDEFTKHKPRCFKIANLGTEGYLSMMKYAVAMVGNSSSGIVEAASFKLPVVNIGNRQQGRFAPKNVINVECVQQAIYEGIRKAISSDFRGTLKDLANPYNSGQAANKILQILKTVALDESLLKKRFCDLQFL